MDATGNGGRNYRIMSAATGNGAIPAGNFGIYDNGATTARFVINSTGNVGIGTTAPTSLLSVNGTADKVGGGSWGTFSDKRLKKNINEFTLGLDAIKSLKTVTYEYNGLKYKDDGKTYV